MNALSKFIDAETLFFKSLNYFQEAPSVIGSGDKMRGNICIPKPKGLRFSLNVKDHFGRKEFNFDIIFQGVFLGNDAANNPRVSWTMTPDFSKNNNDNKFTVSGTDVWINEIGGSIITTLTEVNPIVAETDCAGNSALSKVEMKTIGGEINYIEATANAGIWGDLTIKFNNLVIVSDVRSVPVISSRIRAIRDSCGIGAGVSGVAKFTSFVDHVKPGEIVTYKWRVTGGGFAGVTAKAEPKGPLDQRNFSVQLAGSSFSITVFVEVTVTDASTGSVVYHQTDKFKFTPETKESIKFKTLACRIRSYTIVNLFIDPLWDPLRDFSIKPVERREFDRLNKFAKTVLKDLSALSKLKGR